MAQSKSKIRYFSEGTIQQIAPSRPNSGQSTPDSAVKRRQRAAKHSEQAGGAATQPTRSGTPAYGSEALNH
nr:hypothetical protein Itr_chr11CG22690 [Ipomoea trifida]